MESKVPCYLRTLRRQWALTQEELGTLVPKGRRTRVSNVERGFAKPRAAELLAYSLIFGRPPQAIFPAYAEEIIDEVMRCGADLYCELEGDESLDALRKSELLDQMLERAALPTRTSPNV